MITTLPQTIQYAAKEYPNHEAFRFGSASLSYSELNLKTDQLAAYLSTLGLKKGDRVGVYMHRCLETAIAIYGIMKAGGAYVPLDPSLPIPRIAFLLNDCGIEHLVTSQNLTKKHKRILELPSPLKSLIGVGNGYSISSISWEILFEISLHDYKGLTLRSNDLAYIMYTSGSTGNPKGIMHTHYSGLSYARLSVKEFGLIREDRLANHAPLHFDISTLGYLSGPLAGATTVIVSDAHTKMPSSLGELIEKERISVWYSVPLALVQLLQSDAIQHRNLAHLRSVLYGGELFANKYVSQLIELCPTTSFYNVYGPAEINQCTCYRVKDKPSPNEHIPIGTVWGETSYKILDKNDQEVEQGLSGELVVATSTMMQGYWNNNQLTQDSLYKEEKDSESKHFYRTGDLVKENDSNELLFLGRNDRQIKIRGYRIEIDEIEAVIMEHEHVHEAAVVALDTSESVKEIMAAVILNTNSNVEVKDVLNHCKGRLPAYSVPRTFKFMTTFPRTGSGKIDRKQIVNTYTNG